MSDAPRQSAPRQPFTPPKRPTVAVVTPVFPPYRGGIGTVAELDARQLSTLGMEVHVFVPAAPGGEPHAPDPKSCGCAGMPYAVHDMTPWFRYGKAAFVPQVAGLLRRYDLVLLHHPFFGGTEPLVAARTFGVGRASGKGRLLVTYHMDVVGRGLVAALSAPTRWCMPLVVRAAEKMLVTSRDYAARGNLARLFAARSEKFSELPISTDIGRFAPVATVADGAARRAAMRARHGIGAGERLFVMVGGLDRAHYFKGVPVLLEALARPALSGARALIVGDGDLRPQFEARARELGLGDRAVFAGAASDDDLADSYRCGDVFAFPSIDKSEAFGIVALEALACGVPVVASDLAGVRTLVRDGVNGLTVPPNDASALASALAALRDDPARAEAFGRAGREIAVREYSDAARLAKWRALLGELNLL